MLLQYNGIDLEIERVVRFEMEAVYSDDGVDFLYNHAVIAVRAVWNSSATSFDGAVAAASLQGTSQASSLRFQLMVPRRPLFFTVPSSNAQGYEEIIVQPEEVAGNVPDAIHDDDGNARYPSDAQNGPKPLYMNVVNVLGENTMIIDYCVETWIGECDAGYALLSTRWEMSQTTDIDNYTTQTVRGIAKFRSDYLYQDIAGGANPDDWRRLVVTPVPMNCRRYPATFVQSSDGTELRWETVDVEQPMNVTPIHRRITRVEGVYGEEISQGNAGQAIAGFANLGIGGLATVIGGVMGSPGPGVRAVGDSLSTLLSNSTFPCTTISIDLTVYGDRNATNEDMLFAAAEVIASYGFDNNVAISMTNNNLIRPFVNGGLIAFSGLLAIINHYRSLTPTEEQRQTDVVVNTLREYFSKATINKFAIGFEVGIGARFVHVMAKAEIPPSLSLILANATGAIPGVAGAGQGARNRSFPMNDAPPVAIRARGFVASNLPNDNNTRGTFADPSYTQGLQQPCEPIENNIAPYGSFPPTFVKPAASTFTYPPGDETNASPGDVTNPGAWFPNGFIPLSGPTINGNPITTIPIQGSEGA